MTSIAVPQIRAQPKLLAADQQVSVHRLICDGLNALCNWPVQVVFVDAGPVLESGAPPDGRPPISGTGEPFSAAAEFTLLVSVSMVGACILSRATYRARRARITL